jgi:hypothetical protein
MSYLDDVYNQTADGSYFDFTRCQRPNGTYYGTSGKCRKGAEVGAKELKRLKQAAAKGDKKAKLALDVVEGRKTKEAATTELKRIPLTLEGLTSAPDGSEVTIDDATYLKQDGKYYWKKPNGTLGTMDSSPRELYEKAKLLGVAEKAEEPDRKSLGGRFNSAKPLGEGGYAQVRTTEEGTVIKKGEIGKQEVEAQKKLEGIDGIPKVKGHEGNLLEMELAKGRPLMDSDLMYDGPSKETKAAADEFIRLNRDIHRRGVSHGDLHDGNFFYDEGSGKGGLVDFGMARISPVSALQEGLGLSSNAKSGFILSELAGPPREGGSRSNAGPLLTRFEENRNAVAERMRADGLDPDKPLDIQKIDRSQAEKYIDLLYQEI